MPAYSSKYYTFGFQMTGGTTQSDPEAAGISAVVYWAGGNATSSSGNATLSTDYTTASATFEITGCPFHNSSTGSGYGDVPEFPLQGVAVAFLTRRSSWRRTSSHGGWESGGGQWTETFDYGADDGSIC